MPKKRIIKAWALIDKSSIYTVAGEMFVYAHPVSARRDMKLGREIVPVEIHLPPKRAVKRKPK